MCRSESECSHSVRTKCFSGSGANVGTSDSLPETDWGLCRDFASCTGCDFASISLIIASLIHTYSYINHHIIAINLSRTFCISICISLIFSDIYRKVIYDWSLCISKERWDLSSRHVSCLSQAWPHSTKDVRRGHWGFLPPPSFIHRLIRSQKDILKVLVWCVAESAYSFETIRTVNDQRVCRQLQRTPSTSSFKLTRVARFGVQRGLQSQSHTLHGLDGACFLAFAKH